MSTGKTKTHARAATTKAVQPARDINRAMRVQMAVEMRLKGCPWEEIALTCGLKGGKGAAFNLVNQALQRTLREPCEELRTLEALRLDALLTVYWPKAMAGDGWSFDRVLRLMERRALLLGLDIRPDEVLAQQPYNKTITLVRNRDASVAS